MQEQRLLASSIEDERVSTIFGHVHRIELVHRTRPKRDGYTQNFAASRIESSTGRGCQPSSRRALLQSTGASARINRSERDFKLALLAAAIS